jgi:hypothetical protein
MLQTALLAMSKGLEKILIFEFAQAGVPQVLKTPGSIEFSLQRLLRSPR